MNWNNGENYAVIDKNTREPIITSDNLSACQEFLNKIIIGHPMFGKLVIICRESEVSK